MKFTLTPVIDRMIALYQLPRNRKRFETYLQMLQGDTKDNMLLPIAGYNPMGKVLILEKLQELKTLNAEEIIKEMLSDINQVIKQQEGEDIAVVLNVADDIGGAWSHFYATDFSTKFNFSGVINRNFCTPYFWTSEDYTEALIIKRAKEAVHRTRYWRKHGKPITLKNHVQQEIYVQSHSQNECLNTENSIDSFIELFYSEYQDSEDYNVIFNFFYGDTASETLAYPTFGMIDNGGFEYVKYRCNT